MLCYSYSGLLLPAWAENSSIALGTWLMLPSNAKFFECSGNPPGAFPHSNKEPKTATAFGFGPDLSVLPKSHLRLSQARKLGYILMKTNNSREVVKFRFTDEPRKKLESEL